MRGRKPTPTVIRLLRNNPGKRPINVDEPIPDGLATECPEELTDPVARETWTRTIVPAINRGQVTSGDRENAIGYCALWAQWRSQDAEASRHPHVVASGPSKHPIPNPARGMANKTWLMFCKTSAELGLTPSSRSRVTVNKAGRQMSAVEKFKAEKRRRA